MKNYLLTKIHNGYAAARACPPMKNLFTVPRRAALKDLANKYPFVKKSHASPMTTSTKKSKQGNNNTKLKELKVTVEKGTDLASKDSNGLSDPYVVVKIGDQQNKTKIIYKTLNPSWRETLVFTVTELDELTPVTFICMDWDLTGKDDYMGEFTVLLKDLVDRENEDKVGTHVLQSTTGDHVSGSLTITCRMVSQLPKNAPANMMFLDTQSVATGSVGSGTGGGPTSPFKKT